MTWEWYQKLFQMFQIGSWSHPEQGQVVAGEEQGRPEPVQAGL